MKGASRLFAAVVSLVLASTAHAGSDSGNFVGTTPCEAPVRAFLDIPPRDACERIRWDLWLAFPEGGGQLKLQISVEYGAEGAPLKAIKRTGRWQVDQGMREHPDALVYKLILGKRELALWRVGPNTVHFIDAGQRNLLVGNGGYGFALSTATVQKSPTEPAPAPAPEMSYTLTPLASGPEVFGVFEGRTPCDLGQVLGIPAPRGCLKLKWRLTLFQHVDTHALTRYRMEGALFPAGPREGVVTRLTSTSFNADATVFKLEAPPGAQPVYLMRGDDNVLFFVDKNASLGLGNRDFNFVLYRRS